MVLNNLRLKKRETTADRHLYRYIKEKAKLKRFFNVWINKKLTKRLTNNHKVRDSNATNIPESISKEPSGGVF